MLCGGVTGREALAGPSLRQKVAGMDAEAGGSPLKIPPNLSFPSQDREFFS